MTDEPLPAGKLLDADDADDARETVALWLARLAREYRREGYEWLYVAQRTGDPRDPETFAEGETREAIEQSQWFYEAAKTCEKLSRRVAPAWTDPMTEQKNAEDEN